jgi:hypothetical protein
MPAFRHSEDADGLEAGKVEVAGVIVRETAKAILLDEGGREPVWLPKSKVRLQPHSTGLVSVFMPRWLAREKGII